ncbi:hypothetical protein D5S19_15110 [Amycolatopsis panacis]|uniref:Uncharacterized protein n=1 Tax=Amycolatopsis panacis TaxID=2340917 RepID=A0A419I4A0_9PSEU|nr:hypothetical protein D5S19_15110 [Amycolatopsis panacis]
MAGFDFRAAYPRLVAFLCLAGFSPGPAREAAVDAFARTAGDDPRAARLAARPCVTVRKGHCGPPSGLALRAVKGPFTDSESVKGPFTALPLRRRGGR